jgi:hypothetical protein
MTHGDAPRTGITIAQAWSAPIVVCAIATVLAIWGLASRPEASGVIAALVILIVGPVTATALIARGIVGVHQRFRWRGAIAIVAGILLFAVVVVGFNAVPWSRDSPPQW